MSRFVQAPLRSAGPPLAPRRRQRGASLVEYVLLVALLAAVCVGAVTLLGTNANAKLSTASDALK